MNKSEVPGELRPQQVVRVLETILPNIATYYQSGRVLEVCGVVILSTGTDPNNIFCFCFLQLSQLLSGLKKVGHLLEADHSEKLDQLQMYLIEICQDSTVEITLRLNILEIIELRSLGWSSNPHLEHFYQEKKAQFEQTESDYPEAQQVKSRNFASALLAPQADKTRSASSNIEEDDKLKFQTSVQELFPNTKLRVRECVVVEEKDVPEKLFLTSTNSQLVKDAKACLSQYFKSISRQPGVQQTRARLPQ